MEQGNRNDGSRKERFEAPQAEVILFGTEDVITASDGEFCALGWNGEWDYLMS